MHNTEVIIAINPICLKELKSELLAMHPPTGSIRNYHGIQQVKQKQHTDIIQYLLQNKYNVHTNTISLSPQQLPHVVHDMLVYLNLGASK